MPHPRRWQPVAAAACTALASHVLNCGGPAEPAVPCSVYPDWQTSPYVLPYAVGTSHEVMQGNCTSPDEGSWASHQESGLWAFAYDFLMPVGTPVVAARGGVVFWLEEQWDDSDPQNNTILVEHEDGTVAGYGHLTHNGALADVGQTVSQGEVIALSGWSGGTDTPHLHFQVSPCPWMDTMACRSIPVNFRNTTPNPWGLLRGEAYEALAY